MKHLTDLFKIMQLTRSQPQYGYVPAGIKQGELSNLAEHHYLVTFIAWQLARQVQSQGAKIDVLKVVEISLIHDIGELFGGDIAMLYANINPKAREHAKAFEKENQLFLAEFFGGDKENFKKLLKEMSDLKTDESLIAKIADYMEHPHFMNYAKYFPKKSTFNNTVNKIQSFIFKIKDPIAKRELKKFIENWGKNVPGKEAVDIICDNNL